MNFDLIATTLKSVKPSQDDGNDDPAFCTWERTVSAFMRLGAETVAGFDQTDFATACGY